VPTSHQLAQAGRHIFITAGCGGCHTLAAAHAHGHIGPDFDTSEQLNREQIRSELTHGDGVMPSFRDRLTPAQMQAVTEFVYGTLHRRH
jgi:mono/diheme cytochrome c family protein